MNVRAEQRAYFTALGAHIGRLRKERGFTQAEMARAIGVSQQALFAYELGERRVSVFLLARIARVLQIPVAELVAMARPVRVVKCKVSPRAMHQAERLQSLRVTDQRFVVRILDALEVPRR